MEKMKPLKLIPAQVGTDATHCLKAFALLARDGERWICWVVSRVFPEGLPGAQKPQKEPFLLWSACLRFLLGPLLPWTRGLGLSMVPLASRLMPIFVVGPSKPWLHVNALKLRVVFSDEPQGLLESASRLCTDMMRSIEEPSRSLSPLSRPSRLSSRIYGRGEVPLPTDELMLWLLKSKTDGNTDKTEPSYRTSAFFHRYRTTSTSCYMSYYNAIFLKKQIGPAAFNAWISIPVRKQPSLWTVVVAVKMDRPFKIKVPTGKIVFLDSNNNRATTKPQVDGRRTWFPHSPDQIRDEPSPEPADFAPSSSVQSRKRAFGASGRPQPTASVTASDSPVTDVTATPQNPMPKKRGRRRKNAVKPVEPPSVAAVRKSARVAQAKEVEKDEDTVERLFEVPKYLLNETDRRKYEETPDPDECLINPDEIPQFEPSQIKEFLLAASIKLGADEDACLLHLKGHAYDIRAALNSIDDPNSAALSSIVSESGPGYWSTADLEVFVYECNNPRVRGRVKKLQKVLPTKSRANIVNAYHRLKCYLCPVPRDHYFCSTRIHGSKPTLGYDYVKSGECQNCNHELPNGLESGDIALCAACGLYFKLYGEMRQNAEVTEEVFNFDPNTVCPCSVDEAPIPDIECFNLLTRVKGREVFFFSGEDLKTVAEQMQQHQCSDVLKKVLNSPDLDTYTHIVIGWPGLLKLPSKFATYDVNENAPNAVQSEVAHKRILWDNLTLLYRSENPDIAAIVKTLHHLAKAADGTYSFEELRRSFAMFEHDIEEYDQESLQNIAEGSAEDLEEFLSPSVQSPDFFYFGRITKDDEFESVFDPSCYDYFNWLSVNDDGEVAPAGFTPPQILDPAEEVILAKNQDIGVIAFAKAFFESKRSAVKTAHAHGVSEAFVRTFGVKHKSAIQNIYNSATKLFRPSRNTRKTR
uniref:Non-specific serine/threonine protein kinase n=1 Tax=Panagrellus redivivus TaxID=6233 RepID=A0A7E4VNP2_PANRE